MVVYKCPKCGNKVNTFVQMSNPPIHCYHCTKCDYAHKERDFNIETVAPIAQQPLCGSPEGSPKPATQSSHKQKRCRTFGLKQIKGE